MVLTTPDTHKATRSICADDFPLGHLPCVYGPHFRFSYIVKQIYLQLINRFYTLLIET